MIANTKLLLTQSIKDALGIYRRPGTSKHHILAGLDWLCLAQDKAGDGGVAAWYSLISGWRSSYIETTGYIIDTFLDCSVYLNRPDLKNRAIKMADFLIAMEHPSGGYRTAVPNQASESPPTVFNTGQDLLGMTHIYEVTKNPKYLDSAVKAADFLLSIQESDGSWLKNTYGSMKHTYHTRAAWGILKVWKITKKKKYLVAGRKNLDWATKQQQKNGWFRQNHLPAPNPSVPYTHTIAYAIEGFMWSGFLLNDEGYIEKAMKAALPLAKYYVKHNFLPGTFDKNWHSDDRYSCLTGDAQLALVWLELYKQVGQEILFEAAQNMLKYLRTIQATEKTESAEIKGAIPGSFPLYGDIWRNQGYCRLAYLNWSTKFFIDALVSEQEIIDAEKRHGHT